MAAVSRRKLDRACWVVGAMLTACCALTGCGDKHAKVKHATPAKATAEPASAATKPVTKGTTPREPGAEQDGRRRALASVYAWSRCVMLGVLAPSPKGYTNHGFKDDAAFQEAFLAAAKADPLWARKTVESAQEKPCHQLGTKP